MTMTNIGVISYGLDRAPGGIGRYTKELIAGLRQADAKLTLLHAGEGEAEAGVVHMPRAELLPGLLTFGQAEIARAARQRQLDIVHDPTGAMPLFLTGGKRVATIHDVIPYIYPKTSSVLDWLIYRLWLPLAVCRLDAIVTDSEQSKRDIVRYLRVSPQKVTVVPCAAAPRYQVLDTAVTFPILAKHNIQSPYILYVGSIEARKNLPRLLEAFAEILNWSSKWKLVIVGARKWKSSPVYDTMQQLGLAEHVQFTGYVDEEDLPALYNGADLFVFPSLYEGFGLPVLEAMACGTPVVTSNRSSLPEVAGKAAVFVNPEDASSIAYGIKAALENPGMRSKLSLDGLVQAQQFSWERTVRETMAVYDRILQRGER